MLFDKETLLLSWGDFVDLYYKAKLKGSKFVLSKIFKGSFENRVSSKWDSYASVSDFWIVPEIKKSWNRKISGNENIFYEEYVSKKYLQKKDLNLLSIGCGDGGHERNFARNAHFDLIIGVDVSPESINKAKRLAAADGLPIDYRSNDFFRIDFEDKKFDVILFNASLHHFDAIDDFLRNHINPLLKKNGMVVVYEYCGPNRLQWRNSQLKEANRLLKELPKKFKMRADGKNAKKKIYRPGLIRMLLNDPSEAPDSANLSQALRNNFNVLEETKVGWNILHILLKDISHNFLSNDQETVKLLHQLIDKEDEFVKRTGENDAIFGVYQKR